MITAISAIAPLVCQEIFVNFRFISKPPAGLLIVVAQCISVLPLWATAAIGQTSAAASPAFPPTPMTEAAPAPFRSAFEGYQPYTDEKIINWKEANDSTGRIGGWRAYAKETRQTQQAPESKPPAPDAEVKPAAPAGPAKPAKSPL